MKMHQISEFVRPRRIVHITFADFEPWTECYGPFRTRRSEDRFVADLEAKGYNLLAVHHDILSRRHGFKVIPSTPVPEVVPDTEQEEPWSLLDSVPQQRKVSAAEDMWSCTYGCSGEFTGTELARHYFTNHGEITGV